MEVYHKIRDENFIKFIGKQQKYPPYHEKKLVNMTIFQLKEY